MIQRVDSHHTRLAQIRLENCKKNDHALLDLHELAGGVLPLKGCPRNRAAFTFWETRMPYKSRLENVLHNMRNPVIGVRMELVKAMAALKAHDPVSVMVALLRLDKHVERIELAMETTGEDDGK